MRGPLLFAVFLFSVAISAGTSAYAAVRIVGNNTIVVFAQSYPESQTNFIQSNQTLTNCPNNRAYIDPSQRELYAAALSAGMSNRPVTIAYEDAAPVLVAAVHGGIGCKVLSLWW